MKILDQSSDPSLRNTARPLSLVSTLLWNTLCCHISLKTVFLLHLSSLLISKSFSSADFSVAPYQKHTWIYEDLPHPFCLENQLPSQRKISNCSAIICPGQNQCFIIWPFPFTSANLSILHKLLKASEVRHGHVHAQSTFIAFINQRYYLCWSLITYYSQLERRIRAPCWLLATCTRVLPTSGNADYLCFPNWLHPAHEVGFHLGCDLVPDALSWPSKGENTLII